MSDSVEEVLRRAPSTARVFMRRGMACVGCALAGFETVAEVAASYGVSEHVLLRELRTATRKKEKTWRP